MNKKNISSYLITFCMSLFLAILSFVLVTQMMLFNHNRIYKAFESTNYYESVREQINQNLQFQAGGAGISPELFSEFMDIETISNDIKGYIDGSNENDSYQEVFTVRLKEHLKISGYSSDDINSKEMQDYIEIQASDYVNHIKFPFLKYYTMAQETLNLTLPSLITICIFILLISLFLLKKGLNKRSFYKWVSYGSMGSGSMLFTMPIVVLIANWVEKVNITPDYYYQFFIRYVNDYLWTLILISLILFTIGIVLFVLSEKEKSID